MEQSKRGKWIYPKRLAHEPERPNSVKLLKGKLTVNPGHITSKKCNRCIVSTPKLVAVNHGDPNLMLVATCLNAGSF